MDRQIIDFVLSEKRTTAILRYYDEPDGLRNTLEPLTFEKRVKFLDEMGEISQPNFNRLVNDPDLTNQWLRYYNDLTLRGDFQILSKTKQIDFLEIFGEINEYWFNRFKRQPYLFDRFNTASGSSLTLAAQNPRLWIRINRYYIRPNSLGTKLSSATVQSRFGDHAVNLVNSVEQYSQTLLNTYKRSFRDENFQLVSRMVDKETGKMSDFFTNFPKKQFKTESQYISYRESLHPNIREIVVELENTPKSLYNIDNIANLNKTGHYIGAHAEIRALNDLVEKRFGNQLVGEDVFNDWIEKAVLGYNRNVVVKPENNKVIMPTCADCFYITDLVTFIK